MIFCCWKMRYSVRFRLQVIHLPSSNRWHSSNTDSCVNQRRLYPVLSVTGYQRTSEKLVNVIFEARLRHFVNYKVQWTTATDRTKQTIRISRVISSARDKLGLTVVFQSLVDCKSLSLLHLSSTNQTALTPY